jgi:Secretion system C-terminal sorting domain/Galactose oxidase, central domain/Kelch motif
MYNILERFLHQKNGFAMKRVLTLLILMETTTMIIAQNYGSWREIDSMNIARVGHALVVLPDSNVLVSGNGVDSIQSSAEIYDFKAGKWRYTTPMNVPRSDHYLVLLNTGKVLAIGGYKERSCELFDPLGETWTMTDSIPTYRWFSPTVTELINGNILVVGGGYVDTITLNSYIYKNAEIYDLENEKWKEVTPMNLEREYHTATLLKDGRVLVTGGITENSNTDECEIYDPSNDTWTITAPMLEKRWDHTAILLTNGNVFTSGGNPVYPWLKSCEVYNVSTNEWTSAADMLAYRTSHQIYYLSKIDKLLILGGDAQPVTTEDTWEIYDPVSLTPLYEEAFPINQFLYNNNVQLINENIFVAGEEEYEVPQGGLPFTWATNRSWLFDVTTDVDEEKFSSIKCFLLEQNYPNPFNPITKIRFTIPTSPLNPSPHQGEGNREGFITLKVYDMLGREVATLVNEEEPAGNYEVEFDGSNLPSGMYIYKIQAGEFSDAKKMLLLK